MMTSPTILRHKLWRPSQTDERGVTIILVALSMVGILAMAALSIDVVTLYLARLEAQRAADAAALAAARVISVSGVTGDQDNTSGYWATVCTAAKQVAQAVASQSIVSGAAPPTATVTFLYGSTSAGDCSSPSGGFPVNPQVQVQVQRAGLPTFFARMWSSSSNTVTATATAEAFNPSGSGGFSGTIVPVLPRCVKPWIVPNKDPMHPSSPCPSGTCTSLVSTADGSITTQGISLGGTGTTGVIGEEFWLVPDCNAGGTCLLRDTLPIANTSTGSGLPSPGTPPTSNLEYLPGQVLATSIAAPTAGGDACADATSDYAKAITGCDQAPYKCGVLNGNTVDLSENPRSSGDTTNGARCLIHQSGGGGGGSGQDTLDQTAYPFAITGGTDYPLTALKGNLVTSSNSIVSVPIYDQSTTTINATGITSVTIVGFLQVFINKVDGNGNVDVTVMNVSGCGNPNAPATYPIGTAVAGSSPVPVRLITPP